MRVSQPGNRPVQNSEVSSTRQTAQAAAAKKNEKTKEGSAPVATDGATATISARAREMAQAKDVASSTPDIREEKIAELKRRIAAGQYKINPEAIADRMVDDHLKTNIG